MLVYQRVTGWWLTYPSEKYAKVSWNDEIPNIWKNKLHVPNHQASSLFSGLLWWISQNLYAARNIVMNMVVYGWENGDWMNVPAL